jgi:hypothetical protein
VTTPAGQGAEAVSDARLAEVHRALVADRSIQFEFAPYVPPKPPGWLEPLIAFFKWLSPAFPYLFWGAIALGVLTALYLTVSNLDGFEWLRLRRGKHAAAAADDWQPGEQAASVLLSEAEALAAQGLYAEAARLLLRRSVEDIAIRLPQFLKPSLTARDIAGAAALPGAARPAFAAIARVVEVSAFGSRAVSADAWAECRAAYARFALPVSWSSARADG